MAKLIRCCIPIVVCEHPETVERDAYGKVKKITDTATRTMQFAYGPIANVKSVTRAGSTLTAADLVAFARFSPPVGRHIGRHIVGKDAFRMVRGIPVR